MEFYQNPHIWANVIGDSVSTVSNSRMTTLEIQIPRFILAELNTHGMLKKNTQSSRAVPIKSMLDLYNDNFFIPAMFGKNQSGMSSENYLSPEDNDKAIDLWCAAERNIRYIVEALGDKDGLNVHKQWSARLYEPFMYTKLVITGTEWENFEWLRDDLDAAQPEMVDLARKIKKAKEESTPVLLSPNMWHMPYVKSVITEDGTKQVFFDANDEVIDVDTALMISASCAAQMSYRKADDSLEKAKIVYDRLFGGAKPHMSPTEHQGKVMGYPNVLDFNTTTCGWPIGYSHMDRNGNYWSGNLKGFVQYRKILEQQQRN